MRDQQNKLNDDLGFAISDLGLNPQSAICNLKLSRNNLPTCEGQLLASRSSAPDLPIALFGGEYPVANSPLACGRFLNCGFRISDFGLNQSPIRNPQSPIRNRAFSLVEILIVIGIIVLMVGLAIPAFNAISGSRSIDSAGNTISAFVGRARLEAIGLQETRGIFFYIDPVSRDTKVSIVRAASRPAGTAPTVTPADPYVDTVELYLDFPEGKDLLTLPSGVGVQFVDDCDITNAGVRRDDGFIGFNKNYFMGAGNGATVLLAGTLEPTIAYGGVILFDAQGRQIVSSYAFKTREVDGTGAFRPTRMGQRFFTIDNTEKELTANGGVLATQICNVAHVVPWQTQGNAGALNPARPVRSQVGFVLYDKATFEAKGFTVTDPQLNSQPYSTVTTESDPATGEEHWLDENATVYLINRYNGTLVKGE